MKLLYVLRHAKSSWDDPDLADIDRPLAPRGRRESARMAEHLRREQIAPAFVLCSSALRALDTLGAIMPALPSGTEMRIEDDLYGADADTLLGRIRRLPDSLPSAMLVGHNPGLEDLVLGLCASGSELDRVRAKFPTAALATVSAPVDAWSDVSDSSCELTAFVAARQLA